MLAADHEMALAYFLRSNLIPSLLYEDVDVVLLADDDVVEEVRTSVRRSGLTIEGLRLKQVRTHWENTQPSQLYWNSVFYTHKIKADQKWRTLYSPIGVNAVQKAPSFLSLMGGWLIPLLRYSRVGRKVHQKLQSLIMKNGTSIYQDLLEQYQPDLLVVSTLDWTLNRVLLDEAQHKKITTVSVLPGWDDLSTTPTPGGYVDWVVCGSEGQKDELIETLGWKASRTSIPGNPLHDVMLDTTWKQKKDAFHKVYQLDDTKPILNFVCGIPGEEGNVAAVQSLIHLIHSENALQSCQILVSLHPKHALDMRSAQQEKEELLHLAEKHDFVRLATPERMDCMLGYSWEDDLRQRASMLEYSQVILTNDVNMFYEASIHAKPVIFVVKEESKPEERKRVQRFLEHGAGRLASNSAEVKDRIQAYLRDPLQDADRQLDVIKEECAYTDNSAGRRTAGFLLSLTRK